MNLADIINAIWLKLDENHAYYPEEEVITNGINPAMRLLTLLHPTLNTQRVLVSVGPGNPFVDLRVAAPRCITLTRVVVGDATAAVPAISGTDYRVLWPATLDAVVWQRDWFQRQGVPNRYWQWGHHWIGVYPRPFVDVDITLIFNALPLPFTINDVTTQPSPEPEMTASWHSAIIDVGFALLLVKQGAVETEKAAAILSDTLGKEPLAALRGAVRQLMVRPSAPPSQ